MRTGRGQLLRCRIDVHPKACLLLCRAVLCIVGAAVLVCLPCTACAGDVGVLYHTGMAQTIRCMEYDSMLHC
jgi:hypothetical protein